MKNTCFVRSKIHYNTFDGLNYNLLTGCSYRLVHDSAFDVEFDVTVNNDPNINFNSTVKRTIDIRADGKDVHLGQKIGDMFIVYVNKKMVQLPYKGVPKITQVRVLFFLCAFVLKSY